MTVRDFTALLRQVGLDALIGALVVGSAALMGLALCIPLFAITYVVAAIWVANTGATEQDVAAVVLWVGGVGWAIVSLTWLGHHVGRNGRNRTNGRRSEEVG